MRTNSHRLFIASALLALTLLGCAPAVPETGPPASPAEGNVAAAPAAPSPRPATASAGRTVPQPPIGVVRPAALAVSPPRSAESLLQPSDLAYLGAFRLPGDGERPLTFAYGGGAMTYNANRDAAMRRWISGS